MASMMHYFFSLILLCVLFACNNSSPVGQYSEGTGGQSDGGSDSNAALPSVVSIATTVCFVLLVVGCACCCRKGFAKFEETTTTTDTVVGHSYTNFNDFSPPTESTPSYPPGLEPDTVTIEPLPDLSARLGTSPGSISQSSWLKAGDGTPVHGMETGDINLINNPRFQFPRSQLSYVEEMGSGWFGKVLQGEAHRLHPGLRKTRVVIKQLRDTTTAEEQVLFLQEVQPYREVNHPNVLLLLGQCIESMPFLLILEYAPFGDLKSYLQKHQDSVQDMAHRDVQLRMACDMVSGLMWLHQADFIHIDLAARNCLVCADTSVKIGDYGLSLERYPDDYYITKDQRHAVPIRWLGPEVMEITDQDMVPKKVTKESNVWSFGVIMLELSTGGQKPYHNLTNEEVLKQVVMEQEIRLDKPNLDVRYASRWFEIMMFCWLESDMRPTMKEIHELLIHLRSNRDRVEMDDFQHKWDALKPSSMHDSSESSNPDDSQLSETTKDDTVPTDGLTSGVPNGYVTSPQGQIIIDTTTPNINMNANVDTEPVINSGNEYHTTPLGDILKSSTQGNRDSEIATINKELDFVIQPTVVEASESAPPVSSKANVSDDIDFDPFVQPTDQDCFGGNFGEFVSPPVAVPAPTNIPEVLISSPTSPPATDDDDDDNLMFEEEITPVESSQVQAAAPTAVDADDVIEDIQAPVTSRSEITNTGSEDKEEMVPASSADKVDTNPFHGSIDMQRIPSDDKDVGDDNDDEDEDDGDKTPSNVLEEDGVEQISNPIFDFDMQAVTGPRVSMETSLPEDEDAPRTSTPSSQADDVPGETPYSDDDSSLSFTSAVSHQTKRDDDDSSSYHTIMTQQSEDPSFYSFSSPSSSRNDSIQLSTDGSFKTLTDGSEGSDDDDDDLDEQTFVDRTPEPSDVLEDSISDGDVTPTTPQKGFVSLSDESANKDE